MPSASSHRFFCFAAALAVLFAAEGAIATQPMEADFIRDIGPIFVAHCVKCHGADKRENGLRLDTGSAVLRGGDNGPAVVPGNSAESLLFQAVTGTSDLVSKMPLKAKPLSEAQIALVGRWIDAGAKVPLESVAAATKTTHWAFQKPARPPVPKVIGTLRVPSLVHGTRSVPT